MRTKSLTPEFCSRQAAVNPATPPPTIAIPTLVQASAGTSTLKPSRNLWPNTSDVPTISPSGNLGAGSRLHAASAKGTPRNEARISRLLNVVVIKHELHASLVPPPFAFVISNERLVIETVDLHRHWSNVTRQREHRCQRLIVQKLQPRRRMTR